MAVVEFPLLAGIPAMVAPPVPETVTRKKARASAFAKADQWVMTKYRQTVLEVGVVSGTFGAWDVTERYEAIHGKLSESNRKALGGLYAEMLDAGFIEDAGVGKRPNGNKASIYKLKQQETGNAEYSN